MARNLIFSAVSQLTTRLFNAHAFGANATGNPGIARSTSFLTPLIWTFSAGLGWTLPRFATLTCGLASAKLTYVRDKKIFDQLKGAEFYGVGKEHNPLFEYGLSLHLLIDRDLNTRVHWNCDLLLFKNYRKPVDLELKNRVGIRISRYLKTTIQSHISYESAVTRTLQVENTVSLGFSINL